MVPVAVRQFGGHEAQKGQSKVEVLTFPGFPQSRVVSNWP